MENNRYYLGAFNTFDFGFAPFVSFLTAAMFNLFDSIDILPKTAAETKKKFRSLEIKTLWDLINYFPFRYESYEPAVKIEVIQKKIGQSLFFNSESNQKITARGSVKSFKNIFTKRGYRIQKAILEDETGAIDLIWFNQYYLKDVIRPGLYLQVAGKLGYSGKAQYLQVLDYDIFEQVDDLPLHTRPLTPIYPEKKGVSSRIIREKICLALDLLENSIDELLPVEIVKRNELISEKSAYRDIHFPSSAQAAVQAQRRLAFDEMFALLLSSAMVKREWLKEIVAHRFQFESDQKEKIRKLIQNLDFTLTKSQTKAVNEILTDLAKNQPMNRLLQGDVGSGKTVVAAIASYLVFLNGFKTVFMAPTEILARQHFTTLKNLFDNKLPVVLYTSACKATSDELNKAAIIVGTHALIYKSVDFNSIGLVVIDEQHKFGVRQRAELKKKSVNPHLLTMTATPIPRTILLTLFGELAVSTITELPKGRPEIKTFLVPPVKRDRAYEWIKKEIKEKKIQVFIVCPLIEMSDAESLKTVKAAKHEFENLSKVFEGFNIGLLHGKLKAKEKTTIMEHFGKGKLDILITTPVVEVGIDFPNATIIIIEAAERFGLSQLHQLRGRVGRGTKLSYCFLFTEKVSNHVSNRLKTFARINSGLELAEYDLKNRGAGEIFGTRQHGFINLKIASLSDFSLIAAVQNDVNFFLKRYKTLNQFPVLKSRLDLLQTADISRD